MVRLRAVTVIVLLMSIVLGVAGCGVTGSDGTVPSTSGTPGTSVSVGSRTKSTNTEPTKTSWATTPAASIRPTGTTARATRSPITTGRTYSQEEIDYFLEVALGSEYGDSEQVIKKWAKDLKIEVLGAPTEEDMQTLESVIEEISGLVSGVKVLVVERNPNVEMHFAPEDDFESIEENYVPVNYGFFWSYWNARSELYRSRILISTDEVTQAERSHLIREEVTQVLGLMNDSSRYIDSIFYEGWTETNRYSELDKSVIEMLYREDIEPGMTTNEVVEVLEELR